VSELHQIVEAWAKTDDAWRSLIRHDEKERVCWMPGHDTGFHDHDHSAAAITVLEGAITEERLSLTGTVERQIDSGETLTIAREAIHRVRHTGQTPAVTLHAYSPPLQRVGTYEFADDGALLRHPRPAETPLEAAA
jgi:mannose-6-phosphate isomerase-like protein (cupin superfamily)